MPKAAEVGSWHKNFDNCSGKRDLDTYVKEEYLP